MIALISGFSEARHPSSERNAARCAEWVPEGSGDLGAKFLRVAERYADQVAFFSQSQQVTYGALANAALGIAWYLRDRCTGPRQRVLLLAGNTPEYLAGFYGSLLSRQIAVPLPESVSPHRLQQIWTACEPASVLTTPTVAARRGELLSGAKHEIIDCSQELKYRSPPANASGDDPAALLYTSGSTGTSKGVLLSHRNLLANAASIRQFLPIRPGDRSLALLPFCHAYGNSVLQTHLLAGGTLVVDGSPTFPNSMVEALRAHEIASFAVVPEMVYGLLALSELGQVPLPELRYMTVAGGPLRPDSAVELAERIAPAELFVMYGQTEATARLAYLPPAEIRRRPGSIGRAIPDVDLCVRGNAGETLSAGEVGELWARGPNIMCGYFNDVAASARVLDRGWLRTGDLAMTDEAGFLYLHGRRTDELKLRGLRVDLKAVAAALQSHFTARVQLVPFETNQAMRLALFAEASGPEQVSEQLIHEVCRRTLARHEQPHYVEIVDHFPQTASWKLDTPALARRAAERYLMPVAERRTA